ncbi:MAG: hypothetical protein ISP86_04640 [Shewanellaceae bacterium]|nr:hypothetical protein [Shewanellaceae bacterium]
MGLSRFGLLILCGLSFSTWAVPKHPWYVGGGVGYAFQHQDLKYNKSVIGTGSTATELYESMDFAHGLYSHANIGFYITSMHRLKLGYGWFPTAMKAKADGQDKGTWHLDNEIFILEYDFLLPMPLGWSWTVGAQLGSITSILTEIENQDGSTFKPDDIDLGGFSYGFQTGFEFHVSQVVMGLKGIFLINQNNAKTDIQNGDETFSIKEDYSLLVDFSLGFVF